MNKRTKTSTGQFSKKRSNTLIWTIEKAYWIDLKVRSDKKLWNHLKDMWYSSLSGLLKEIETK